MVASPPFHVAFIVTYAGTFFAWSGDLMVTVLISAGLILPTYTVEVAVWLDVVEVVPSGLTMMNGVTTV